jgi:hypothetical protein
MSFPHLALLWNMPCLVKSSELNPVVSFIYFTALLQENPHVAHGIGHYFFTSTLPLISTHNSMLCVLNSYIGWEFLYWINLTHDAVCGWLLQTHWWTFASPDRMHFMESVKFSCVCYFITKNKLHGLSLRANYTDRATAASRRSDCQLLRIKGATWSAWRIPTAVFSVF